MSEALRSKKAWNQINPHCVNGSARSVKYQARNKRIKWLLANRGKLKTHLQNDTVRLLILEMKKAGLYSINTHVRDIMIGFPNLVHCIEGIIEETLFDPETQRLRLPTNCADLE